MKARNTFTLSLATAVLATGALSVAANGQRTKGNGVPSTHAGRSIDQVRQKALVDASTSPGTDGSLAAVDSLYTQCFESLAAGPLNGVDQWVVGGTAPLVSVDIVGGSLIEGTQSVQMGTAATGGPTLAARAIDVNADDRFSLTVRGRLSALGTAAQTVEFQAFDAAGVLANRFRVIGTGAIQVRDLNAGGTAFIWAATGQTVAAGVPFTVRMEYDPNGDAGLQNGLTRYYRDGSGTPFYTGNGTGGLAYDIFQVSKINALPAIQFDCLTVDRRWGSCEADIAGFDGEVNVSDLLAVISAWGTCPAAPALCPANVVSSTPEAIDVSDLLAVISSWGSCPVPTGACCVGSSCSVSSFDACQVAGGGTGVYYLNDSDCVQVVCPDPLDNCATALAVNALPFNDTRDPDGYTLEANEPPTPSCGFGGLASDWWYLLTVPAGVTSIDLVTCNTPTVEDSLIAVYSTTDCAAVGPANQIGCNDDSCEASGFGRAQILGLSVSPGQQLLVYVANYGGGGSNPDLSFQPVTVSITAVP